MNASKFREHRNLKRLHPSYYRGLAHVHWTFTIKDRKTGYLSPEFFSRFQLVASHACHRYHLISPCCCLMPDHLHLLLAGIDEKRSDQKQAVSFLRKHLKSALQPFEFQRQAYDHVMRDHERSHSEFQKIATYITENPVRAGLCGSPTNWPYTTAMVPGFPELNPSDGDYWELFWRIYHRQLKAF